MEYSGRLREVLPDVTDRSGKQNSVFGSKQNTFFWGELLLGKQSRILFVLKDNEVISCFPQTFLQCVAEASRHFARSKHFE